MRLRMQLYLNRDNQRVLYLFINAEDDYLKEVKEYPEQDQSEKTNSTTVL